MDNKIPTPTTFPEYIEWGNKIKDLSLDEFLTQVRKYRIFTIAIKESDCEYIRNNGEGNFRVGLNISGTIYEYITRNHLYPKEGLWTYNDNNGDYKKSVFYIDF